jgi:hypothetical protein
MHSGRILLLTALLLSACFSSAFSQTDMPAANYTLQVASFPDTDSANKFIIQLVRAGEHPACTTVELQGRGYWTRVFLGFFATPDAARDYGERLKARGVIDEFLVRKAELNQTAVRPRRVSPNVWSLSQSAKKSAETNLTESNSASVSKPVERKAKAKKQRDPCLGSDSEVVLPSPSATVIPRAPSVDISSIPRPDPVGLAFRLIVGYLNTPTDRSHSRGGLWVTGDTAEGLSRLQWIAGDGNARLIRLREDGRVELNKELLATVAGIRARRVKDPIEVASYIASNEGLLLLVQLVEGNYRYILHIGNQVPTRGKTIDLTGSVNLDNNYDSRINPYRKDGRKLNEERPPEGVASIVGLNPVAQWFNLSAHSWVPVGEITLHELAEAYAKVALGLDYLQDGANPGAHEFALERERRLKSQRPGTEIVLTAGSNRVLRSQEEIRLFYAEVASDLGKQ